MNVNVARWIALLSYLLMFPSICNAQEVLFEDNFDDVLSLKWEAVGLKKEDYRVRDGGLELRVQSGKLSRDTGMLRLNYPINTTATVTASVDVTIIDEFSEPEEFAGLYLTDGHGLDFGGRKQLVRGQLAFSPGKYDFIGNPGEEGDPDKYTVTYWPADKNAGPLRIIVRNDHAYFQVGPSSEGKSLNFFHSAIGRDEARGFALVAAGAPGDAPHWVRFDNFRITK